MRHFNSFKCNYHRCHRRLDFQVLELILVALDVAVISMAAAIWFLLCPSATSSQFADKVVIAFILMWTSCYSPKILLGAGSKAFGFFNRFGVHLSTIAA